MLAVVLVRGGRRETFALAMAASVACMVAFLSGHPSLAYAGGVGNEFLWGFPRVGLTFSLGILLFTLRRRLAFRLDRRVVATAFVLLCLVPALPGALNPIVDGLAVAVAIPMIVLASASEAPAGRTDGIALWSGRVSYPLYAIHYPFVRAAGVVLTHHGFGTATRLAAVAVLTIALVALAALFDAFYDRPVRRRLGRLLPAR